MIGSRRWAQLLPALPPLLAFALYLRTVGFGFVWDDHTLTLLPVYADFDLGAIWTSAANGVQFLPIRDMSFALDAALFGQWAGGYHLTNVLLFASSAALLTRLYSVLLAATPGGLGMPTPYLAPLLALVCVAHPLQVESVSFISCRNTSLALPLSLASLLAYARFARGGNRWVYTASVGCATAAMLAKQTAICLPLLILLLQLYLDRSLGVRGALGRLLPLFAATAATAGVHVVMALRSGLLLADPAGVGLLERLPLVLVTPLFYLLKFVWPAALSIHYAPEPYLTNGFLGLAALAGLCLTALVAWGERERPLTWFAALGSLAALLPVMNLLPTYPWAGDRYAHLALPFFTLLVCAPLARRLPLRVAIAALGALVVALSLATSNQIGYWRDDGALFQRAAQLDPQAVYPLENLGTVLWSENRREEAIEVFARIKQLVPDDCRHDLYRGWQALDENRLDEAAQWLESATKQSGPLLYLAHVALAQTYERQDRSDDAQRERLRARALLERDPLVGQPWSPQNAALRALLGREG